VPLKKFKSYYLISLAITLLFVLAIGIVNAQQTYNPKGIIPLDPAYKTGTLANGIKYIIRNKWCQEPFILKWFLTPFILIKINCGRPHSRQAKNCKCVNIKQLTM